MDFAPHGVRRTGRPQEVCIRSLQFTPGAGPVRIDIGSTRPRRAASSSSRILPGTAPGTVCPRQLAEVELTKNPPSTTYNLIYASMAYSLLAGDAIARFGSSLNDGVRKIPSHHQPRHVHRRAVRHGLRRHARTPLRPHEAESVLERADDRRVLLDPDPVSPTSAAQPEGSNTVMKCD